MTTTSNVFNNLIWQQMWSINNDQDSNAEYDNKTDTMNDLMSMTLNVFNEQWIWQQMYTRSYEHDTKCFFK